MNVYDFDGTIYDGDSTKDFLKFVYLKYPQVMFPLTLCQGTAVLKYLCRRITKEEMKEKVFSFLSRLDRVDAAVSEFWDSHENKIKKWYPKQQRDDDIVISASPDFLLKEICVRKGIAHLIATTMDSRTGKITGKNCRGAEKPKRFREEFGRAVIDNFYSDHDSDIYMAKIAGKAWLVKGNKILPWREEYKGISLDKMNIQ